MRAQGTCRFYSSMGNPLDGKGLRFDGDNVNDNTSNQWFDWLNKEKWSCSTLFGAMFWRSLPNDHVKIAYLRFSSKSFILYLYMKTIRTKRAEICATWPTWNNRKRLNLTQSSILMWRFRCSCRRSFLNSLLSLLGQPCLHSITARTSNCVLEVPWGNNRELEAKSGKFEGGLELKSNTAKGMQAQHLHPSRKSCNG